MFCNQKSIRGVNREGNIDSIMQQNPREMELISYNAKASSELRASESCVAMKRISGFSVSSRSKGSSACKTKFRTLCGRHK